jgi:hypothetical protein
MDSQTLASELRRLADIIEDNDSFEGRVSYTCLEEGLKPGEYKVDMFYRYGNRAGQGFVRMTLPREEPIK